MGEAPRRRLSDRRGSNALCRRLTWGGGARLGALAATIFAGVLTPRLTQAQVREPERVSERAPERTPERTQVTLDVGSASVRQPQGSARLLGTFGAGVWHQRSRFALGVDGAASLAIDSTGAQQLTARSAFAPTRWSRTDIDGTLLGATGANAARTAQLQQALVWRAFAWSVSAGTSRSTRETERGPLDFFGNRVGTGLTFASGPWRLAGYAARSRTNDYVLMEASGVTLTRVAAGYALDDGSAEVSYTRARVSLAFTQQWRRGREATTGRSNAASVLGAVTLGPGVQLVAQTGMQLADVLRAIPQARYLGVSLRWIPTHRAAPRERRANAGALSAPMAIDSAPTALVTRTGEVVITRDPGRSTIGLVLDAPAEAVVEVMSSATNWTPARAVREGSAFTHKIELPAGTHTIAVRINGGAWRAPRGLVAVSDDFGGTMGKVTVP